MRCRVRLPLLRRSILAILYCKSWGREGGREGGGEGGRDIIVEIKSKGAWLHVLGARWAPVPFFLAL